MTSAYGPSHNPESAILHLFIQLCFAFLMPLDTSLDCTTPNPLCFLYFLSFTITYGISTSSSV
jgi:hypothetical protein